MITEGQPTAGLASSHREAPLISGDARADNTDLYAFVSPDKPDTVTLISNWIPFEEPNGGPNFYPFAENTHYIIRIDNNGDGQSDIDYMWSFQNHYRNATGQFLYNTPPILNKDQAPKTFVPFEELRLNMAVPVTASPNRLGVLGGDLQGFPNGIVQPLAAGDAVNTNDHAFGTTFPYVALPNTASVNDSK